MNYITNLAKELVNINFNIVPGLSSSQNITDITRFMTFSKRQGHIIYGVAVINCDIEKEYKKYAEIISKGFNAVNGKKIFLTIFVSSDINEELVQYSTNNIYDYNADFLEIKWIVDKKNNNISVNGEQPTEVLDVRQAIVNAFENNGEVSVNTNELKMQRVMNEALKIKCTKPYITYALIIINTIFWAIMYTKSGEELIYKMALDKQQVSQGEVYRLFTYMFTHGGLEHYICNNFSLYILGSRVEKYTGHIKFVVIYLISGIVAGCTSFVAMPYGLAVGASGAIFGVAGLLIYLSYKLKHSIGGFDFYLAVVYAIIGAASGFLIPNVDNFAHIGGLICGIILSALIKADK